MDRAGKIVLNYKFLLDRVATVVHGSALEVVRKTKSQTIQL